MLGSIEIIKRSPEDKSTVYGKAMAHQAGVPPPHLLFIYLISCSYVDTVDASPCRSHFSDLTTNQQQNTIRQQKFQNRWNELKISITATGWKAMHSGIPCTHEATPQQNGHGANTFTGPW